MKMLLRLNMGVRKLMHWAAPVALAVFLFMPTSAKAEGSADLTENGGYRPYAEWQADGLNYHASPTKAIKRQQVIEAYIKAGETVYFGSSMSTAKYVDTSDVKDIGVTAPDGAMSYYDVEDSAGGAGFIQTRAQEKNGPNQLRSDNAGYNALTFTAAQEGIYEFRFYARKDPSNPTPRQADAQWGTQGTSVAAWDITVADAANNPVSGRVYSTYLSLNTGDQNVGINSVVYVLTHDGYIYETNFNGLVPSGFLFFANNRGLIDLNKDMSFYHSTLYENNKMDTLLGNIGFSLPLSNELIDKDVTFRVFFNKPDAGALKYFGLEAPIPPAEPERFQFNGDYAVDKGAGGDFTFASTQGSSYLIKIEFGNDPDNVVYIGDYCSAGEHTVHWDGLDKYGNPAEYGTYTATLTLKGGEYHFPLADAERSPNGIHIGLINTPADHDPSFNPNLVYYDNSDMTVNGEKLEFTSKVDIPNHRFHGALTQLDGIDSSIGADGKSNAMQYVARGTEVTDSAATGPYGNLRLFDIWTYYSSQASTVTTPVRIVLPEALGELKISKTVTGTGADTTKVFTFHIALDVGGAYPYTGSKAGRIGNDERITLLSGESITIHDIPIGAAYTVMEENASGGGYTAVFENISGNIQNGVLSEAAFVNRYVAPVATPTALPTAAPATTPPPTALPTATPVTTPPPTHMTGSSGGQGGNIPIAPEILQPPGTGDRGMGIGGVMFVYGILLMVVFAARRQRKQ